MYYQDQAIILKRKNFKDNDSLITCYTEKHGKLVLRAIGAKKILSKLSAHLEPINLSTINWIAGKGGEKLTGANTVLAFKNIKSNYEKLNFAQYFLEIIDKAVHTHHPDKKIFLFLKSVLEKLDSIQYRHELSVEEKFVIKKVISLKIDEIIKLNLDKKVLNLLYKKAQLFWEEIIEEEIKFGILN